MRLVFISTAWVVVLILAACGGAQAPGESAAGENGTYTNIAPDELAEILENKDFAFVNVHIPYEGEIEHTDQFIAFEGSGPQRVNDYPADKNAKIVLYCRSGRMSAIVANELVKAGYTQVWNLEGGMIAWENAGYPLLRK